MAALETGPYLTAALFCEHYLRDQDGLESFIRIVDRVAVPTPSDPEHVPPAVRLTFVMSFKAGEASGSVPVTLRTLPPSGMRAAESMASALFEGEDRGTTITVPVRLEARMPGVYWFEIVLNDALVTKVPLRVLFT